MSKQSANSLFAMDDYRAYVRQWVNTRGRGEYRRIALQLHMHTTLVSQVFGGKKCLTEEQASSLCAYMSLSLLETDYFLKLVQLERAGSESLKANCRRQLLQIRRQANEIKALVPESKKLSESDRALFYSSWQFGLVRLLTSIDHLQTPEKISGHLGLPLSRVQEILQFLVARDLCTLKNERYIRTRQNTHVENQSALSTRHHQNWRTKSLEMQERLAPEDLAFTAPIVLAKSDRDKVRQILLNAISEISRVVDSSPSESVAYLGIDWIGL